MLKTKVFKIILVAVLLLLGGIGTVSAMETPAGYHIKGTLGNWIVPADTKVAIDKLVSIGGDSFSVIGMKKDYIDKVRNHGATEYYADAINYAHTKNVKFYTFLSMTTYSANRELFKTDIAAQNAFVDDLRWVLETYPSLDGISLEEAQSYVTEPSDGGLAWRTFLNAYFTRLKNVILEYHNLDDPRIFEYNFNIATNNEPGISKVGIDTVYINEHKLFNAYIVQPGYGSSVSEFEKNINNWKARFPNFLIIAPPTLTSSGLITICGDPPGWNDVACWNQGVFKQTKWALDNNIPARIYVHARLSKPRSLWPNETIPGANGFEKVKYIWGSSSVSLPEFFPDPSITYTAPVDVSISTDTAGAAIRYTKDDTPPLNPVDPVPTSPAYAAPINITTSTAFKARAWKTGLDTSAIASASYTLCLASAVPPCTVTLTSINVSPSSASIAINATKQFTATALDQFGNTMTGIAITWTSSDPAIATVDASGKVKGISAGGPVTITAASGTISDTASVTVTVSLCGNGEVDEDEACDKNGNIGCDEATPNCNNTCSACTACVSSCPAAQCANIGQPDTGCGGNCPDNLNESCSDGNLCTLGETCQADKTCGNGIAKTCNDFNLCTTDSCNPLIGCAFTDNAAPCDDGNLCTLSDTCSGGLCRGAPKSCADADNCTFDSCDPATGSCTSSDVCGGLVPCGRLVDNPATTDINEQAPCTLCSLFYMIKSTINYAAQLSFALAILALVISGLLYSTSAGDSRKIDLAKRAAYYAIAGLFVVFLAWLIIAVILQALGYAGIGTWNQVNCGG